MQRETLGLVLGFVGVVLFGGSLPFTRLALESLDPWFVTAARAALAGLVAGAVLLVLRRPLPNRAMLGRLALASLCLVFGFPGFTALAMESVGASHGGVVLGIMPLATALAGVALAGERPTARFWLAAVAGAAVVTGFALREGAGRFQPGDLLLAGAVVSAALGYALSGQLTRDLKSGWEVISWALVLALPVSFPLMLLLAPAEPAAVSLRSWIGLGYVALMSQYLGFFAWNAGLAVGGIARVSQVQLLQTFVTLILAATLNGERVDALTWLVAVLVVGLVLAGRKAVIRRPGVIQPDTSGQMQGKPRRTSVVSDQRPP